MPSHCRTLEWKEVINQQRKSSSLAAPKSRQPKPALDKQLHTWSKEAQVVVSG